MIDEVASRWEDVAVALGFSGNTIDIVKRDEYGDASTGCSKMFQKWLKGAGSQPPTWETLVAALYEAKLDTLANKIETTLTPSAAGEPSTTSTSTPSPNQASTPQPSGTKVCCVLRFPTLKYCLFVNFLWMSNVTSMSCRSKG